MKEKKAVQESSPYQDVIQRDIIYLLSRKVGIFSNHTFHTVTFLAAFHNFYF